MAIGVFSLGRTLQNVQSSFLSHGQKTLRYTRHVDSLVEHPQPNRTNTAARLNNRNTPFTSKPTHWHVVCPQTPTAK